MSFSKKLLVHEYFPRPFDEIPFGDMLNDVFFKPNKDNLDYPLHGPNVIRFIESLVECSLANTCGLLKSDHGKARNIYLNNYSKIIKAMDVDLDSPNAPHEKHKITELLKVAALFHDIGKYIRKENHPQIGANILHNYDAKQRKFLLDVLRHENDHPDSESNHHRFSLITSIIQHHDKFGVVSTGEGALPIFSDILYFTSNSTSIRGIKKNITSVMLLNLADIAAVNILDDPNKRALSLAIAIGQKRKNKKVEIRIDNHPEDILEKFNIEFQELEESQLIEELSKFYKNEQSCLGLPLQKMTKVLDDWKILIDAIDNEDVRGNRVQLKKYLMELERNPSRTINRVLRILQESSDGCNVPSLLTHISPTSVEAKLVGTLGAHQFQTFCEQFATVVKLDYGLNFFKAIICACVRNVIHRPYSLKNDGISNRYKLNNDEFQLFNALEHDIKVEIAEKVTTLFVRVLEGLIKRYEGVLEFFSSNPRRFGFELPPV